MNRLSWLGAVRHGESVGNVLVEAAEAAGEDRFAMPYRDPDTPLSPAGEAQAAALGGWLAALPPARRPDLVLTSPYLRAAATARIAMDRAGLDVPTTADERLRDRELGVLEGLTRTGLRRLEPAEAARQRRLGRFYYRPPGGEAWTDVALRLRAVLSELSADRAGQRVLLVAHDIVVVMLRYLVDGLDEARALAISRHGVPNCSLTSWHAGPGGLEPQAVYDVAHLARAGVPATHQPHVATDPI